MGRTTHPLYLFRLLICLLFFLFFARRSADGNGKLRDCNNARHLHSIRGYEKKSRRTKERLFLAKKKKRTKDPLFSQISRSEFASFTTKKEIGAPERYFKQKVKLVIPRRKGTKKTTTQTKRYIIIQATVVRKRQRHKQKDISSSKPLC